MSVRDLFVGLMSGTSLDGVDAALVELASPRPALINTAYLPLPEALKAELHALQTQCQTNWIAPQRLAMSSHAFTPKRS